MTKEESGTHSHATFTYQNFLLTHIPHIKYHKNHIRRVLYLTDATTTGQTPNLQLPTLNLFIFFLPQ